VDSNTEPKSQHAQTLTPIVILVAASGFLTDSYNLFATNVILPALAFIYWPSRTDSHNETLINILTLVGSIVGQVGFGLLADRLGRQRLYGLELIIVTVSTLGLAQSGYGIIIGDGRTSMDFLSWTLFWRFVMGIGIGAEYPLSAVITSEWAATGERARMLATVFLMQPLGQLFANVVAVIVLAILNAQYGLQDIKDPAVAAFVADKFWRGVTGFGVLPALVALVFRLTIPESGRWTIDVCGDGERALKETEQQLGASNDSLGQASTQLVNVANGGAPQDGGEDSALNERDGSVAHLRRHFIDEGNWRAFVAAAGCWFLLDFAYYGIQINTPRFLAKLWASSKANTAVTAIPSWLSDPATWDPTTSTTTTDIYHVLVTNAKNAMISVSIGSIVGSLVLIKVIPDIPRRKWLYYSFAVSGVFLAATGVAFLKTFETGAFGVTLMLFILVQFLFNVGPNALTFIVRSLASTRPQADPPQIPAEIFPTPWRCTCHGLAAAAGKLASVVVQSALPYMRFGASPFAAGLESSGPGWEMLVYSLALFLGAALAWKWTPELQAGDRGRESLTLEELAEGRVGEAKRERERMAAAAAGVGAGPGSGVQVINLDDD
jgi:PHS family inorganic phosphate transporter-like MFS transporter